MQATVSAVAFLCAARRLPEPFRRRARGLLPQLGYRIAPCRARLQRIGDVANARACV